MVLSLVLSLAVASSVQLSLAMGVESPDFNATQAVIDQGFNISAVPALATLTDQSSVFACGIAVGDTIPFLAIQSIVDKYIYSVNLCNPFMAKTL